MLTVTVANISDMSCIYFTSPQEYLLALCHVPCRQSLVACLSHAGDDMMTSPTPITDTLPWTFNNRHADHPIPFNGYTTSLMSRQKILFFSVKSISAKAQSLSLSKLVQKALSPAL